MGTVKEWREVLLSGAFWGSFMLLWDVFSRPSARKGPARYLNLLGLALAGFFFGLGVTFGFRVFRWPLITVMGPTMIAMVLVGIVYRKILKSSQSNKPSVST